MATIFRTIALVVTASLMGLSLSASAQVNTDEVQTAWRLLDYIAVDYGGSVAHGKVTQPSEYAEQNEFAALVGTKIGALPVKPQRQALMEGVARLKAAIADKAEPAHVADIAHEVAAALLEAYPVPLAPNKPPTFARGEALFTQQCGGCHGANGDGHGPAAASLATPPIAFTDLERARQRSIFALYQVITQGLDGTPMPSFASLTNEDRWALAFYTGHFAFSDSAAHDGERLWKSDAQARQVIPDLKTLVGMTPAVLESRVGTEKGDALMGYLRRHPDAMTSAGTGTGALSLVRERLSQSIAAYRAGNREQAGDLALSAYLDGFEPVEPTLGARDSALLSRIEGAMGEYRSAIQHGESADALAQRGQSLDSLFDEAEQVLSSDAASSVSTFVGAATILLREGLEALLIVAAMIAFVRKAGRHEVMPYIHGGWIGALVAGLLTWIVATSAMAISGASRELMEGVGSVFAAVVLIFVGIWMHGKAQAGQWQRYIREKMAHVLSGRSAWVLFGLVFVVVYREVFETILFYAALWTQGDGLVMLAGALTAVVALVMIAWGLLRYSQRLPIGKFFSYSSWLMAVLAVVLAGKGMAALQEAGIVGISALASVPRITVIGLFPTLQTIGAQILMVAALVIGFRWNHAQAAKQTPVHP